MNQHGGRRLGSGRLPNNPILATEKRLDFYRNNFPNYSEEDIRQKIIIDAKRLGRLDICNYMEDPDSYKIDHLNIKQNHCYRKPPSWDIKEAIRLRECGMTYKEIALEVGAPSSDAVYVALKSFKNKKREFNYKRAVELKEKGLSYYEIGAIFELSPNIIRNKLNHETTIYEPKIILEKGTIYINECSRSTRRTIGYQGKVFIYARIIWDFHNPQNMLQKGEIIHHIDENTMNDDISNLKKVTPKEHKKLHKK